MNLDRVAVVGTSGVGKSTFARRIAELIDSTCVELDSLFWNPGWRTTEAEVFVESVKSAVAGERWVIDGNYASVRSHIWSRASTLIWLNYPFRISFARLLGRTIRRCLSDEKCCNGNREEPRQVFFSKDSILLWAIKSHPIYKREYPVEIPSYPNLAPVEFRHPKEADAFLSCLEHAA